MPVTVTLRCRHCGSDKLIRYGFAPNNGKQKYFCRECGRQGRENPSPQGYPEEKKEEILRAYQERSSLRGLERTFGVRRETVSRWIKKRAAELPPLDETLVPAQSKPTLELDELWSFVRIKTSVFWVWIALCRLTRQVVGLAIGDRDATACRRLWESIPEEYRKGKSFTDFLESYAGVIPEEQHLAVGKESGETAHVERFNLTLRQRVGRLVRKTLSFSKSAVMHEACLKLFIWNYNLKIRRKWWLDLFHTREAPAGFD